MPKRHYIDHTFIRGINTRNDSASLPSVEGGYEFVRQARNCQIQKDGFVTRRAGVTEQVAGSFHSVKSFPNGECLVVEGGDLKRLNPDYTRTTLMAGVGGATMRYAFGNDTVFFTNGSVIGKVEAGAASLFDAPDREQAGKVPPPPGHLIAWYRGVLYVASGDVLWHSDPLYPGSFDYGYNYLPLNGFISLLAPVENGIWVADGKIHFLAGASPMEFSKRQAADYNAVLGEYLTVNASRTPFKDVQGDIAVFPSEQGVCFGLPDGALINSTVQNYVMPSAVRGRALHQDTNTLNHMIFILEN